MAPTEQGRPVISVMVVDDDEATLNLLGTFLRRNGYRVITATNPVKALELLQHEDVRLVITDLMMPHVDGISFTQQVHQIPRHRDVPVIMITAFGSDEVSDKGMRRGVAMTLAKPLELSKLLDLVGFATAEPPPKKDAQKPETD
ncbi:MAG: response regulator [Myxococcales bacterium]|nr:response regulator [Myxococcales bacterium]